MPVITLLLGELWMITAALDRLRFLQAGIPSLLGGIPYSYICFFLFLCTPVFGRGLWSLSCLTGPPHR